jgi:hypothetical protein
MIGHKNPTMYMNVKLSHSLGQPVRISRNICVAGETDLTVDTTLNHMNGNPGWAESKTSGHLKLHIFKAKTLTTQTNTRQRNSLVIV